MSEINNWLAETNDAVTTLFGCLSCNRDRLSTRGYNVGNHKKPFDSSWSTSDKSNVCGVGINFRADKTGALVVKNVVSNGPAAESGQIQPGDTLYKVDGMSVMRMPISAVSSMLLGAEGSMVNICFLRVREEVSVDLVRSPVKNLVSTPSIKGGGDARVKIKTFDSAKNLMSPDMINAANLMKHRLTGSSFEAIAPSFLHL